MTKRVIGFHYHLTDKKGNVLDSSKGQDPLIFLEGANQIISGLEKILTTMKVGEKRKVEVEAKDAYGEIQSELVIKVARSQFPEGVDLKTGDQFQIDENPHSPVFSVTHVIGDEITIDGNHPMAGKDLVFDVEITEVRSATQEELSHGHAHGDGGHHH